MQSVEEFQALKKQVDDLNTSITRLGERKKMAEEEATKILNTYGVKTVEELKSKVVELEKVAQAEIEAAQKFVAEASKGVADAEVLVQSLQA